MEEPVAGTPDESGTGPRAGSPAGQERVRHFIGLLEDEDELTRIRAAEALGRIGDPIALGPLIDTLWDDDARVRLKAAWALGRIGDAGAVPALRRLYRMEREDAQEIIRDALEAIRRAGAAPPQ